MFDINFFEKVHSDSIKKLESYFNHPEYGDVFKWISELKYNPCVWMDTRYYNNLYTLEGFIKVCELVYSHLINKDDSICYPYIDGELTIYFGPKKDCPEAEFISDIYEFMYWINEIHVEDVKHMFIFDVVSHGDYVYESYSKNYPDIITEDFRNSLLTRRTIYKKRIARNKILNRMKERDEAKRTKI